MALTHLAPKATTLVSMYSIAAVCHLDIRTEYELSMMIRGMLMTPRNPLTPPPATHARWECFHRLPFALPITEPLYVMHFDWMYPSSDIGLQLSRAVESQCGVSMWCQPAASVPGSFVVY